MKRFARWVIVICVVLAVLIGGATAVGRVASKPNQAQALGFDLCEGKPCLLGVKPGMQWAQAKALLERDTTAPPTDRDVILEVHRRGAIIIFYEDKSHQFVERIQFRVADNNELVATFSDFLDLYGMPCDISANVIGSVSSRPREPAVTVMYPNFDFTLIVDKPEQGQISPSLRAYDVILRDRANSCRDIPKDLTQSYYGATVSTLAMPWTGFATYCFTADAIDRCRKLPPMGSSK